MEVCLPQEFYFLCIIFLVCVLPLVKQVNHLTLGQPVICSDLYLHTCSGSDGKGSACTCRRPGFDSWDGKIPCRRERRPTPVFFLAEFHGQRSLADYSPWGHKESDTTDHLNTSIGSLRNITYSIMTENYVPKQTPLKSLHSGIHVSFLSSDI